MFEPTNRFMLVDALRPPPGHTLATAVGTSFTLELDALLLATLSFAVADRLDTEDGKPDPIALLESVRRHADNMTLFAQAGALSGPRSHPPILSYLEESVVPVRPARPGHLFHPKVWALKFVDAEDRPSYRLLVLSRNLTFDSSWDTIVRLDSHPTRQTRQHDDVVGDFFDTLPNLAVNRMGEARRAVVEGLAAEIRDVAWERPDDVRSVWFHPLGPAFTSPTIAGDRVLVMSPFLTESAARTFGQGVGDNVIISRPAAFDGVGAGGLSGYDESFVIDSADELPESFSVAADEESAGTDTAIDIEVEPPRPGSELSGLHAKVWVTENDDYNRLWIGSANATGPAFDGNVEFLVECCFNHGDFSIDSMLDDGEPSLRSMLLPYTPAADEPAEPTEVETAIRKLDALVRDWATGVFSVTVQPSDDDYVLDLTWPDLKPGQSVMLDELDASLTIGPATRPNHRVPWTAPDRRIESASLEAITSFLTIEARTRVDGQEIVARSLVNGELIGAPHDRKEQLLSRVLDDPEKVLRYLLYLLSELTGDTTLLDALGGGGGTFSWTGGDEGPPILESLLKALAHAPESLDRVAEFVTDLQSGDSAGLLPPAFDQVWEPINQVRRAQQ